MNEPPNKDLLYDMSYVNDEEQMKTGKDLIKFREKRNWSQADFAYRVNFSPSRIGHIEAEDLGLSKRLLSEIKKLKESKK